MSLTSYKGLAATVGRVEIPMLQRDYAQGRPDAESCRIRDRFLAVLHRALTGGPPVVLDFVYGEINGRTLVPLDGQQRLTTLFLLHWYLSARLELPDGVHVKVPKLSFQTRESSRRFCETLIRQRPFSSSEAVPSVSEWLRDQPWFAGGWRHDPTIAGMLVVLDALHALFKDADCAAAWERLVDAKSPAIAFDFVQLSEYGLSDDLYVKMNSRGRPLTPFELFKAEFGALLKVAAPDRHEAVDRKLDGAWTDLLWRVRDARHAIDERYLRYFRFATYVVLRPGDVRVGDDDLENARAAFGAASPRARENLQFLESAFDTWGPEDVPGWFGTHFTHTTHEPGKVALFEDVDLFLGCCAHFGDPNAFSLWKTLLLFAVLVHRGRGTADFPARVRVLRNLLLNSSDDITEARMPALLRETERWIVDGRLDPTTSSFRRVQAHEEVSKYLSATRPAALAEALARLEDHPLLRGCVGVIDVADPRFAVRATAFAEIFSGMNGMPVEPARRALLARGDYAYRNSAGRPTFGADTPESWRVLLTRTGRGDFVYLRDALRTLLDAVAQRSEATLVERLRGVTSAYLAEHERVSELDWRYYLVRYDEHFGGTRRVFDTGGHGMGYTVRLLSATQMNGYSCDPVLLAVHREAVRARPEWAGRLSNPWDRGAWTLVLRVVASGVTIASHAQGFMVTAPTNEAYAGAFEAVPNKYEFVGQVATVSQKATEDGRFDTEDRVAFGVRLLGDLLEMQPHKA